MTFQSAIERKCIGFDQLEALAARLKESGKTVVTLNGSFDLLHPGHLEMLFQASRQGDILIALLNTDDSIRAYKGKGRPVNPLNVRMQHLAALEMVDYVSAFAQLDPIAALEKIRPDVHVNGSEYGSGCIEAETVKRYGGRIHIVDLLEGFSTSQLIERVQALCD